MTSPFPGMDPFVEANDCWPDFHMSFLTTCREQLVERLPENFYARLDERVQLIEQGDRSAQGYRPDIAVLRKSDSKKHAGGPAAVVAELEPVTIHKPHIDTESVGFIEIRTTSGARLVTVIEVLSPANKKDPGRTDYCAKMEHFRRGGIHVVEIDLLLGGKRLDAVEPLPDGDYYAFVSRREKYPECEAYAWPIQRKLPHIPIPLADPGAEVTLDLELAFRTTFVRAGYRKTLRYDVDLPTNLSKANQDWAAGIVIR